MSELQRVGPVWGAAGSTGPQTSSISGATRTAEAHSGLAVPALEGRLYTLDSGSVTVAAADAVGQAIGTATLINGFWNPSDSGYNVIVSKASAATVSGTPAGPFFYTGFQTPLQVTTTEAGVLRAALLQRVSAHRAIRPQVGGALATLPADTALILTLGVFGGPAAVAAGAGLYSHTDYAPGFVVPPGWIFGISSVAAGTTHVAYATLWLEVVPILDSGGG